MEALRWYSVATNTPPQQRTLESQNPPPQDNATALAPSLPMRLNSSDPRSLNDTIVKYTSAWQHWQPNVSRHEACTQVASRIKLTASAWELSRASLS